MNRSRLELLARFDTRRVAVLGDVMLDEYVFGDVARISPDAPVPVVSLGNRELHLGGAGNVAHNLRALGAQVTLAGVVGADAQGDEVRAAVAAAGVAPALLRLEGRPTTHKVRVLARNQQVVRLDRETRAPVDAAVAAQLLERVAAGPPPSALILSDYGKGVLTPGLLADALAWARARGVPVLVDPKRPDFAAYRGATWLTPNAAEASLAARLPCGTREEVLAAGRRLLDETGARGVLVTRGAQGMALVTPAEAHFVDAHQRDVFDVTGAGDTVIATFALCLAAGAEPLEAMALANLAAGVVVGRLGAAACTREDLLQAAGLEGLDGGPHGGREVPALRTRAEVAALAARWRQGGRRVVFTNGCFDLLHAGHVALLEDARSRGDALVVGLNSDASVRRLKGASRPLQTLEDRARLLAALRMVDAVVAFEEDTPLELILALRPDVLVKGGDYRFETIVGAREVAGWGGAVVVVPTLGARSTTALVARASGRSLAGPP